MVKTSELKQQIEELDNKWKRALADYANLEKRINQEKADFVQFANADLIIKLLGVLDHLEKAGFHLKDKGLELAIEQFKTVLKNEGISVIEVLGKRYDPKLMECCEVVKGQDGIVVEVVQKGYFLKDKVIRPAKVKVGKKQIEGGRVNPDVVSGNVVNKR